MPCRAVSAPSPTKPARSTSPPPTAPRPTPAAPAKAPSSAASADGRTVFFTSSEELTDDANTGPDQPPAQIGRATLNGEEPAEDIDEGFIPANALGLATSPDGEYLYWADPVKGTIGRANLKAPVPAATVDPEFIVPGNTEAETHPIKNRASSSPPQPPPATSPPTQNTSTGPTPGRWVASIGYRTRSPRNGGGTVGRATLDPLTGDPSRKGSNLNSSKAPRTRRGSRWTPNRSTGQMRGGRCLPKNRPGGHRRRRSRQKFQAIYSSRTPSGIAVSADTLYVGGYVVSNDEGYITGYDLEPATTPTVRVLPSTA